MLDDSSVVADVDVEIEFIKPIRLMLEVNAVEELCVFARVMHMHEKRITRIIGITRVPVPHQRQRFRWFTEIRWI